MLVSVAVDTVNVAKLDTPESVAVIVVEPLATAVARPLELAALLIVATKVEEESQKTNVVRSRLELSAYIPVAVNCWSVPNDMVWLAGNTWIETGTFSEKPAVSAPQPNVKLNTSTPRSKRSNLLRESLMVKPHLLFNRPGQPTRNALISRKVAAHFSVRFQPFNAFFNRPLGIVYYFLFVPFVQDHENGVCSPAK